MDNFDAVIVDALNFSVNISKKVKDTWDSYRQFQSMAPEAFGVLIGNKELTAECYDLVEVTVPQKGDRCSRMSFTLKDPQHQRTVDHLHKISGGQLVYLGTWHTHPEKIPHASCVDIMDWKECMFRNKDRQLFFVIIGTQKSALYYFVGDNLLRQEF